MKCGRILSFAPSDLHNFFNKKPSQIRSAKCQTSNFRSETYQNLGNKSMFFQGETKKNGAQFDQGWFFSFIVVSSPRSGYLEYAGRRFSVEDLIQMRAVTCDLCHRPIQEEIFSAKHQKKTWRKHQKSDRPACTENSPKHAEHCMNCCIFR